MSLIPPSARDAWSYSGDFHVEASGNNRHRRATVPELMAVFNGTDGQKDRPAHWYEAQLIHYGLPPSKTKGTAKMRLFDAVGKGNLAVPAHILKVETELKKEWNKREREAKQAAKKLSEPTKTAAAKKSTKRKADDGQGGPSSGTNVNINLSLSIGPQGNVQVAPTGPAAKKAKTTPATKKTAPVAKKTAPVTKKTAPVTKKTAPATKKAASATKTATPATLNPAPPTQKVPRTKQTARRGTARAGASKSTSSRATSAPSPASADKPPARQTARRSRPFIRASQSRPAAASPQAPRFDATPSHWDSTGSPPPPYPGPPSYFDDDDDDDNDNDRDDYGSSRSSGLPPLGLLNGRYDLRCTGPHAYADDRDGSGIIFTLDGEVLWGSFEIGPLSGILRLDERPWSSSEQPLYFPWRGEDDQGAPHSEADDGSYIKFLGDGEVVGKIGFYNTMLEFDGCRVSGSDTRSEVSAFAMRREWDERFF